MRLFFFRLGLTMLLLTTFVSLKAQIDDTKFSIDIEGGIPIYHNASITRFDNFTPVSETFMNKISRSAFRINGEYYLPNNRFSLRGGYEQENISFDGVYDGQNLKQIVLGGRYYPIKN